MTVYPSALFGVMRTGLFPLEQHSMKREELPFMCRNGSRNNVSNAINAPSSALIPHCVRCFCQKKKKKKRRGILEEKPNPLRAVKINFFTWEFPGRIVQAAGTVSVYARQRIKRWKWRPLRREQGMMSGNICRKRRRSQKESVRLLMEKRVSSFLLTLNFPAPVQAVERHPTQGW